jgi:CMP-N,N'-diacetyllegionaminic acid synthase
MKKKIIGIIPARGGSKSLPRKNLQDLMGIPLIAFTIQSALESTKIDEVYVSSDDSEILEISKRYGAKIIERPSQISDDFSRDNELLEHAIRTELIDIATESLLVFLRPSHPIRNPKTIDKAISIFQSSDKFDSLRSMKISNEIPYKMWRINEIGVALNVTDNEAISTIDPCNAPRQQLPVTYYQDGYVDVFPINTILNFGNTAGTRVLPFIVDEFSHDIDTFNDLKLINNKLETEPLPEWFTLPTIKT